MDNELRTLERRANTGDIQERLRLIAKQCRIGEHQWSSWVNIVDRGDTLHRTLGQSGRMVLKGEHTIRFMWDVDEIAERLGVDAKEKSLQARECLFCGHRERVFKYWVNNGKINQMNGVIIPVLDCVEIPL